MTFDYILSQFLKKYNTIDKVRKHWGLYIEYTIFDIIDDYYGDYSNTPKDPIILGCKDIVQRRVKRDSGEIYISLLERGVWIFFKPGESFKNEDIKSVEYQNRFREGNISYNLKGIKSKTDITHILHYLTVVQSIPGMIKISKLQEIAKYYDKRGLLLLRRNQNPVLYLLEKELNDGPT